MKWLTGALEDRNDPKTAWFLTSDCGKYSICRIAHQVGGPMSTQVEWRWEAWRNRDDLAKTASVCLGRARLANLARRICEAHATANVEPTQGSLIA